MKAMVLNHYGEQAQFENTVVDNPVIKAGHVIVKVAAVSVNTVDTMIKNMGSDLPLSPDLPAILGMDFAGVVIEVAADVTSFQVGDEVYGCAGGLADLQGALAEFIVADANLLALKPNNLTMKQAAALPLVGITAAEGLKRAQISTGQKILVHGGVGGVGHVAVQLAKYWGAGVYATISNDTQAEIIRSYGATPINYKEQSVEDYVAAHTGGQGFDVIFDSVGGMNMANSFAAAALNGHVISTVAMVEMDLTPVHFKGLTLHVVFMLIPMLHHYKRAQHAAILSELASIVEQGAVTPLLDQINFTVDQVGDAYGRLTSGQATGKVVVEMPV